jgi:hypothetical protein
MKRASIFAVVALAAAAALGAGGAASAKPDAPKANQVAAKLCKAEKHADKAAFKATYGKHAMRECKRSNRGEVADTIRNASQQCKADREADPAAFAEAWGSGPNAHGKCVSATVRELAIEEPVEEFQNAAQACRDERKADPEAFAENYGSNHNQRNAFGKCVSEAVREAEEELPSV